MMHDQNYYLAATQALEAETSVIGALLLDNAGFDRIGDILKPEHFFSEKNRMVFAEIYGQLSAGKPCDVITVAMALGDRSSMSEIHTLAQYVPSSANLKRYTDVMIERFKSRQLATVSAELLVLADDHRSSIGDRVDKAQSQLAKLIDDAPRDEWVSAHEGMTLHTQVL